MIAGLVRSWLDQLWTLAGAVSIRTKILGIVLALVLLLGLGVTLQVRQTLIRTMEAQLQEQSISVARDLAARATDLLLINDLYSLHQLLRTTLANNANVRYAFIVDPQGQVIVHTFGNAFPAGLLDANQAGPDDHHQTRLLNTDEGPIWDTAVPIFEGRVGTARVGLSEVMLGRAVESVTGQLLLTTVLVSLIGVTAAAFLTWLLTRPILNLVQAAKAVGRGDFTQQVYCWADDEIGELSIAFNEMVAALRKAGEERAEREQLRAQYVKAVITAQEDERKRIARELHDSASQSLTSLLVGLRNLSGLSDQPQVRDQVEALRAIAAHTLDEVHTLALQLRPSVLDDLGLQAAIERYVDDFSARYPIHVDLALHGLSEGRLPSEVETALYRIVQESLTNVARHSGARAASVMIERQNGHLRAIIEDDGRGFDPALAEGADRRLGLYGMRERAELLGGKLTVESAPGQGASVFVEIPCASGPDESVAR